MNGACPDEPIELNGHLFEITVSLDKYPVLFTPPGEAFAVGEIVDAHLVCDSLSVAYPQQHR